MAKGSTILSRFGKDKITYQNLAKLNMVAAALLALEALGLILLAHNNPASIAITTNYLSNDVISAAYVPATQHLFDLKLVYLAAAVLIVPAASRGLASNTWRKKYETSLKKGNNTFRWVEHGVVTALLMLCVAMLVGLTDLVNLLLVIWLSGLIAWLGYKYQSYGIKNKSSDWQLFQTALKAGVWLWAVLLIYLGGALLWGRGLPTYLYYIYASMGLISIGFAYNTYQSFRGSGRLSNNFWTERLYLLLTVVATSALAWQIYAGTLR